MTALTSLVAPKTRHGHLLAPERVKDFITGGKSIFTVLNTATGNRGTFRVEKIEGSEHDFEVRAFTGSDNSKKSEYTLFGWVRKDGSFFRYTQGAEFLDLRAQVQEKEPGSWLVEFLDNWAKYISRGWTPTPKMQSRYDKTLRKFGVPACLPPTDKGDLLEKMFSWTWARAHKGLLPETIEVWHEGACCYCAKRLTVPASIELGMGPDCAEERGFYPLWEKLNQNPGQGLAA
jgi:hypothetical protein